jgi:hypothetical protein
MIVKNIMVEPTLAESNKNFYPLSCKHTFLPNAYSCVNTCVCMDVFSCLDNQLAVVWIVYINLWNTKNITNKE